MFDRLLSWLWMRGTSPDIAMAQSHELQRQVPLLYALLSVNALAVAYTHHGLAPEWMTIGVPALLVSASLFRLTIWLLRRQRPIDPAKAIANLRRTVVLSVVIAVAYIAWSLGLNRYGGPYEHAHVAIFIAITVIGCIFCLMHLPQAALAVTAVVTGPYLVFYLRAENPIFAVIALNILLVTLVMAKVLLNSYASFTELIVSRGETERLSRENLRLAHTDALTGLPNRRFFFLDLAGSLSLAQRHGHALAVGLIDLDRFKPVNDTYGHVVGDRLLEAVGERLNAVTAPERLVARLGGDEFGFFIEAGEDDALMLAEAFCEALARPFEIDGITLSIGGSCGVAVHPGGGATMHELFDHADHALYDAKNTCRGTASVYSAEHEMKIQSHRAIEAALRTADLEAEMDIHLQPIIDGTAGRVAAVEALARWTHPRLGSVRPDLFIAVAERAGLMHVLTLALLRKALAGMERLPDGLQLSFNLSAHDITNPQTVLSIMGLVRQAPIDPARLTLELTETAVLRDFEVAFRSIQLFRSLGIRVALDDFGTGYSSLGYLHRLPIDKIKIDRSFVRECGTEAGRNILTSILALCASMGLKSIVEGVEDEAQLSVLKDLGCGGFQGYLFGRPMPVDELLAWLEENGRRAEADGEPPARRQG